jgi:tetratricopeptide (TPR) repeat protein
MLGRIVLVALLLALTPVYFWAGGKVWEQREVVRRNTEAGYVIPSKYSRVLALEYKGLLADFLLLKTITFFGERVEFEQTLSESDWTYIIGSLDVITDLDPYFLDPYVLAEGLLTWESGRYEEANRLLEKGRKYRVNDWQLPFFIGFNHFFFLKDYETGGDYLMQASRLPNSPKFLPSLAARIGYYGDKAHTAVMFLKGIIAQTSDERLKSWLNLRLVALERAALLEDLVEKYQKENGYLPTKVQDLVIAGYIDDLPVDPYGGDWVMMKNGRVFSTSKFVYQKGNKDGN